MDYCEFDPLMIVLNSDSPCISSVQSARTLLRLFLLCWLAGQTTAPVHYPLQNSNRTSRCGQYSSHLCCFRVTCAPFLATL
jgi:hypothetical protein